MDRILECRLNEPGPVPRAQSQGPGALPGRSRAPGSVPQPLRGVVSPPLIGGTVPDRRHRSCTADQSGLQEGRTRRVSYADLTAYSQDEPSTSSHV